ncbi:hypothetical protein AZE42_11728 [Rhizopogon vesiculosus]|uniref:Uncharacterized protein n=1 Tax=Rhizopogon vesiculosus TaxID=180088 RepID=A0A1J8QRD4_9AGAM|nr:hypothetical protein AZE42_11728 [Rhizopogon vesiculosus]
MRDEQTGFYIYEGWSSKEREWHVKAIQRDSVVRGVPFLT